MTQRSTNITLHDRRAAGSACGDACVGTWLQMQAYELAEETSKIFTPHCQN